MAGKQTGLASNFYVSGYNLSGDIGSINRIGGGPEAMVITGIDKSAIERVGGRRDGAMDFSAWFNPSAAQAHPVLSALPTADIIASYFHTTTLGSPAASCLGKQINYDPNRGQDGSLVLATNVLATQYGIEWGKQLTAGRRTDTAATNGSSVDFGVGSTAFGLQAWLHVFSFTGTSCTVKLQESSDNAVGDAFADVTGGGFTAATGITSQRIATSATQTIERYLRVVTTGTFSECTFAVHVTRNDTAVVF